MRETLEGLKQKRGSDENLEPLLDMWEREKSRLTQRAPVSIALTLISMKNRVAD